MWRVKFRTRMGVAIVLWSFLIAVSNLGGTGAQQRFFVPQGVPQPQGPQQLQPFSQNFPQQFQPQPQPQPQNVPVGQQAQGQGQQGQPQARMTVDPSATAAAPTTTPTGVITPTAVIGGVAVPTLDAFIPQLDPFIPKPVLFQLSTNIFNSAGLKVSHFSRFQIWYLTSQILKSVDDRLKPDYITMLQPPLVRGIPSQNLTQALSQPHHPEILKTLIEQSTGMLTSQQAIIVQKIRSRLAEPVVIRMIMAADNPAELFGYFSPTLIAHNMPAIIKSIGELPETILSGTNIQAKLLPRVLLSSWLASVRKISKIERWTADDLIGKSFLGSSNHLDLALLGLGCNDLELVSPQDILIVIGRLRHELYELRRRVTTPLPFPLNIRNCAMAKVLEYLKQKNGNGTTTADGVNILAGLRIAEVDMIGGEILSSIPTPALDNVSQETRTAILEEIGQVDSIDLFNLLATPTWYGNRLYNDLLNSTGPPVGALALPPMPTPQPSSQLTPTSRSSLQIPLRMGNLLFYSSDFLAGNWSKEVMVDILGSRTGSYCLPKRLRSKWADLLVETFGPISSWSPNDLASIGDLLLVLPPSDLNLIPVETLARSVATIMRQSGLHSTLGAGTLSFIRKCVDLLDDGPDFFLSYKLFMRKLLQATQLMVNSVRTIDEVMLNEIGGRVPGMGASGGAGRVRRQAPMATTAVGGGQRLDSTSISASVDPNNNSGATSPAAQTSPSPLGVAGQTGFTSQQQQQQVPFRPPSSQSSSRFTPPRFATTSATAPPLARFGPPRPVQQSQQVPQQQTPQFQGQSPAQTSASTPAAAQPQIQVASSPSSLPSGQSQGQASSPPLVSRAATATDNSQVQQQPQLQQLQMGTQAAPAPVAPTTTVQQAVQPQPSSPAPVSQPQLSSVVSSSSGLSGRALPPAVAPASQPLQQPQQTASATTPMTAGQEILGQASTPAQMGQQQQQPQQQQAQQFQAPQTFDARALGSIQPPRPQTGVPFQPQPPFGVPPGQGQGQGQQQQPGPSQFQRPPPFGPPQFGRGPQQPLIPVIPRPLDNTTAGGASNTTNSSLETSGGKSDNFTSTNGTMTTTTGTEPQNQTFTSSSLFDDLFGRSADSASNGTTTKEDERRSTASMELPKDSVEIPITCRGMKAAGPAAIGMMMTDFETLSTEDLFDCVEPIGLIDWDLDTKRSLLALMAEKLQLTPDRVNTLSLIELGGLVSAFGVADNDGGSWLAAPGGNSTTNAPFDVSSIDLTLPDNLDALSILGTQIEDPEVLKILADKFTLQNGITTKIRGPMSRSENLRVVFWSLGNVICGMDEKIVGGILEADHSLFSDVSPLFGRVLGCSQSMLSTLAESAITSNNFGGPSEWSEQDVEVIGVVVAGLKPSQLATIVPSSMAGLTPLAVTHLTPAAVQALTPAQLAKLPYESALSITPRQLEVLTVDQMTALNTVTSVQSDEFNVPDVVLRGSGDRDNEDVSGTGIGADDVEMVRSLNDTTTNTNGTDKAAAGRSPSPDSSGSGGAGPNTGSGRKKVPPSQEVDPDDEVEVVEVVDVEDDDSSGKGKTRRPIKDKETGRPSSAITTALSNLNLTSFSILLFSIVYCCSSF